MKSNSQSQTCANAPLQVNTDSKHKHLMCHIKAFNISVVSKSLQDSLLHVIEP